MSSWCNQKFICHWPSATMDLLVLRTIYYYISLLAYYIQRLLACNDLNALPKNWMLLNTDILVSSSMRSHHISNGAPSPQQCTINSNIHTTERFIIIKCLLDCTTNGRHIIHVHRTRYIHRKNKSYAGWTRAQCKWINYEKQASTDPQSKVKYIDRYH